MLSQQAERREPRLLADGAAAPEGAQARDDLLMTRLMSQHEDAVAALTASHAADLTRLVSEQARLAANCVLVYTARTLNAAGSDSKTR